MTRMHGWSRPFGWAFAATCLVMALAEAVDAQAPAPAKREWYEQSRCLGITGPSWLACQRALKQKKRDAARGVVSGGREWYEKTRCLGLEGAPWIACQKALKAKKRDAR